MNITVIGGGAIGMLYGARLSLGGAPVRMLTRTRQQAEELASGGIRLLMEEQEKTAFVAASTLAEAAHADGMELRSDEPHWYILTVKQTALDEPLLAQLKLLLSPGDGLLCLQNGIGHLERLAAILPGAGLYAGVTSEGALREGAAAVRHTGSGELFYGPAPLSHVQEKVLRIADPAGSGQQALLEQWKQCAERAGIPAQPSNEMGNRIYHKLLLNAVINPLTALFGIRNGELPAHPKGKLLMQALHRESEAVLLRAGMQTTGTEWDRLLDVCRKTALNTSSMLADLKAGRRTEVGSINGEVARLAKRLGMTAPLNEAAAAMVNALEPLNG
ncbi:2-dehydropantoate 2-reductase [Paenibacillus pasadenensis]|uniref:ketopantoate reductase family protein n=1 Tax=Paenibacillus pasadenensis TaxID=217090 RepID=UPI00204024DD|nr:2-dehydropantoate 2-reductase [Paenibacillus pasadenensis]MCM3746329.1 2-dehydropantoate 2-reductase [Paenibacillus pasadenensis]